MYKKKILFITTNLFLDFSTPILNAYNYFKNEGWEVKILMPKHKKSGLKQDFYTSDIVCPIEIPYFSKPRFRHWAIYFFYNLFFLKSAYKYLESSNAIIVFDEYALSLLEYAPLQIGHKPILFFSLELPDLSKDAFILNRVKNFYHKTVDLLIIQSMVRADLFLQSLQLHEKKVYICPNSDDLLVYHQSELPVKGFFQEMFQIEPGKKILLYLGSICDEHGFYLLEQMLPHLPDEYVIVCHGWVFEKSTEQRVLQLIEQYRHKFYHSSVEVSIDEKWKIYTGIHAGFVFFSDHFGVNHRYAFESSGKLYDFFKSRVPVIANKQFGAYDFFQRYPFGVIFDDKFDWFTLESTYEQMRIYLHSNQHLFSFKESMKEIEKNFLQQ